MSLLNDQIVFAFVLVVLNLVITFQWILVDRNGISFLVILPMPVEDKLGSVQIEQLRVESAIESNGVPFQRILVHERIANLAMNIYENGSVKWSNWFSVVVINFERNNRHANGHANVKCVNVFRYQSVSQSDRLCVRWTPLGKSNHSI